ncbi:HupE/UreJ family protein [Robiginitalea aurantiaca]|uniref:HupE/UreJ family protein n=1 Tax=Robiginitalea aurantiaca TaxID=3056915 RepID=A0ABT7WAS9_9FLAO|nr:HupE/UreJ family protein [Robiginitalea aurantiaca]MDM9630021.1 HupE/UreJ family protein [Robiginitalea aurantiaca]
MNDFWFYTELGFTHVLDPNGYDHVLFLTALALPFTFVQWKKVFWLATLFTTTHCISLALAAYGIVEVNSDLVELLIPVTILVTALFNLNISDKADASRKAFQIDLVTTGFFGLIHGLGFSNYFRMLMAGEDEKTGPLLGFAAGIEGAQILVLLAVLTLTFIALNWIKVPRKYYVWGLSILIALISLKLIFL